MAGMSKRRWVAAALGLVAGLSSCQTIKFYSQAVSGQLEIFAKSKPNAKILADPTSPPRLRQQLTAVEGMRRYASEHLSLPGASSYGTYSDLGRPHVVWVVYAAPEFSLKPKSWYYPMLGRLDYRGFFHQKDAEELATQLRQEHYEVLVGEVDAYSTLGWFHDPVLNTFVGYPDVDVAETIFHELTHHKVFRNGDTVFNESLANVVSEEGVKRWLRDQGRMEDLRKYEGRLVKRREFYAAVEVGHQQLEALYASNKSDEEKRAEKKVILDKLRDQFHELRRRWGGKGLEGWLQHNINNGHIVSLKLYNEQMPMFRQLLADSHGDLDLFFQRVKQLPKGAGSTR
jgi:predicted aminopeptidase